MYPTRRRHCVDSRRFLKKRPVRPSSVNELKSDKVKVLELDRWFCSAVFSSVCRHQVSQREVVVLFVLCVPLFTFTVGCHWNAPKLQTTPAPVVLTIFLYHVFSS